MCESVKASECIMCDCLCVSSLASVCARVSGPQVFDGSCDACQGDDSQLTPILWWVEGEKEGDEGRWGGGGQICA